MLIFENSPVLKSAKLKRIERRIGRIDKAERTTVALGLAGVFAGLSTALFNGLVPIFGSMMGSMDTWGRPEFVGDQLLLAAFSFLAMGVVAAPLSVIGDRLDEKRRSLESIEATQELEALDPEPDDFIEYRVGRKPKWDSWEEYSYHLNCKHYE